MKHIQFPKQLEAALHVCIACLLLYVDLSSGMVSLRVSATDLAVCCLRECRMK